MKDSATPANIALNELPNLGKTTVMWLRAVGIRDSQTLRDRGIFWAYERMQARGFRVTTAVLFSLEGALQDRPWRSFDDAEKAQLLENLAAATAQDTAQDGARALPKPAPRHATQTTTQAKASAAITPSAAAVRKNRAGPARAARKPTPSARPRQLGRRTEPQT